jgi:hypothetical protein
VLGSAVESVIILIPVPERANLMVSVPAALLALVIACRSDPAPLSLVLLTIKSAA